MTKLLPVIIAGTLSWAMVAACSGNSSNATPELPMDRGTAYYFAFEIERITGIPEHQIEEYGCVYTVDRQAFLGLLRKPEPGQPLHYDKADVRAKITFREAEYFINRGGVARAGNEFFLLDKGRFVALLSPTVPGKCR